MGECLVGKNRHPSTVVVLERALINAPPFRSLNGTAKNVLLDFLGKRVMVKHRRHPKRTPQWRIENNGEITYTYAEAENKGIARPLFAQALDQLIHYGFIDIVETGAGICKGPTLYAISDRWRQWGTDQFVVKQRPKRKRWNRRIGFQKGHPFYPKKTTA